MRVTTCLALVVIHLVLDVPQVWCLTIGEHGLVKRIDAALFNWETGGKRDEEGVKRNPASGSNSKHQPPNAPARAEVPDQPQDVVNGKVSTRPESSNQGRRIIEKPILKAKGDQTLPKSQPEIRRITNPANGDVIYQASKPNAEQPGQAKVPDQPPASSGSQTGGGSGQSVNRAGSRQSNTRWQLDPEQQTPPTQQQKLPASQDSSSTPNHAEPGNGGQRRMGLEEKAQRNMGAPPGANDVGQQMRSNYKYGRDIPRVTELDKLQARSGGKYDQKAFDWAVCVDERFEQVAANTIRGPNWLAWWQLVMRHRIYKRDCAEGDGRRRGKSSVKNDRVVRDWFTCMDKCGLDMAYNLPEGTKDVDALETYNNCRGICKIREIGQKTYVYKPIKITREQVLGKPEWGHLGTQLPTLQGQAVEAAKEGGRQLASVLQRMPGQLNSMMRQTPQALESLAGAASRVKFPVGGGLRGARVPKLVPMGI